MDRLLESASASALRLHVDLRDQTVRSTGLKIGFEVPASDRGRLLDGLDEISLTLQRSAEIARYEVTGASAPPSLKWPKG